MAESSPDIRRPDRLLVLVFAAAIAGLVGFGWNRTAIDPTSSALPDETPRRPTGHRIDVNAATPADLDLLPKVGPGLSQAVVEHREDQGDFSNVEHLTAVHGIGPKTLNRVERYVDAQPSRARDSRDDRE